MTQVPEFASEHDLVPRVFDMRRLAFGFTTWLLLFCFASEAFAGRFEVSSEREADELVSEIRAAHFLTQATFGPTLSEIRALARRIRSRGYKDALEEWIDDQIAPSRRRCMCPQRLRCLTTMAFLILRTNALKHFPRVFRYDAWWHNVITADDQLRPKSCRGH